MASFQLFLTLDEINLVLSALGKLPCDDVFNTVVTIRQQTQVQVDEKNALIEEVNGSMVVDIADKPKPKK